MRFVDGHGGGGLLPVVIPLMPALRAAPLTRRLFNSAAPPSRAVCDVAWLACAVSFCLHLA